ncbi:hypothetical protein DFQ27_006482 [Actinomortierella ambigua]|uniref:Oligopeptide transporter n=1 Tax=Actinomortierella ambigua TaxID=1343610 RepID=A0A9P6PXF3_9FUNG|nr:hypothetical protein DFQ27_006482 [Actinomortierella ambigua]
MASTEILHESGKPVGDDGLLSEKEADSDSQHDHEELDNFDDDSPIDDVRVTIPNHDDPSIPCNTFRMWFLGLLFAAIIAFVNQFFNLRQTTISIGSSVVALLTLPLGHFMARVLPTRKYTILGWSFTLNPGPFSIKEHVLIGTMTSVNAGSAYAVDIVILQKLWYHDHKHFIAGLLLVWTTQVTGFAFAGALRRFLVRPAHMVWPANLVTASLFRSLHEHSDAAEDANRIPRMKYFAIVSLFSFVWYWLPGFMFPTIGVISWICWIDPSNIVLSQLTGSAGLGLGTIALDWSAINSYVQPMVTPWFAQVNILVGFVLVVFVMVPWAYYTDLWHSKNFPILSPALFKQDGSPYDKDRILDANRVFDRQKYLEYGPMRMDSFFALTYGVGFAALMATVVHVVLYHGKELVVRWRSAQHELKEDVHTRLMRAYPEVPNWWYGVLFAITISLTFVTCVVFKYMPWWAVILALAIAIFFVLPVGIVTAVTNQQPGLNIITEYVIGYIMPGYAIPNVTFKTYGYIVNVQALAFTSDLKLGHYMKIPPRIMFAAQVVSTLICSSVNLGTATWLITTRPYVCTQQGYPFTCRNTNTFYSASIIWGAIAPARVFGHTDGALYASVQWGFLFGALIPIPFWYLHKRFPHIRWLGLIHWPVLLTATSSMPPALPYFYANGIFVGFIFAYWIRRHHHRWWARYNYLTSAAMDCGLAISALAIFFCLQSWGGAFPHWWGNPQDELIDHCPLATAPLNPPPKQTGT